ncbi:MAG: secretion protein HlyD family protein [Gemmatimonadetes bacterium]|nr:secretion protein HlyD family protein [Gemmatimonadota bacterium]
MRRLLRSRWTIVLAVALVLGTGAWMIFKPTAVADAALVAKVKKGDFKATVTTAGELRAKKFVQITAPTNAQQAGAYQMKISSIVPEGTVVQQGQVVAELDRSTLASTMQEVTLAMQKAQAQYEQAMLDSTLNLSKAREDMRTMELGLEEKRLAEEQAKFEAPTIKRQAAIDLEKAQRALAQAKLDYKTRTEQAKAKMREVGADLDRQKNKLGVVQEVMGNFTIKAPAPGMVIYVKEWSGKKRTVGSQVSAWDPGVATLPDLTKMESITYVNEIDIRKIAVGQHVALTLDSDPSKRLTGTVTQVANVGEQRPNQDAKVFEVHVDIAQADTTLRPGMTTSNAVETYTTKNVLSIPLEAVNSDSGIAYVFRQQGHKVTRQEIETGAMSDNEVVVMRGLHEGDEVLLVPPANKDKLDVSRLTGPRPKAPAEGPTDTAAKVKLPIGGDTAAAAKQQGKPAMMVAPMPAPKKN